MLYQTMYQLGAVRSGIRELFEYGLQQAALCGKENVFDYSLGNPSIPAPPEVNDSIVDIARNEDTLSSMATPPPPAMTASARPWRTI